MEDGNWFSNYAIPGASFGLGVGNSILNFLSQRETNKTQIDLMREQNKFNKDMMESQRQWNSPSAQVQRLSQAGLNPALAFSDSSGSVGMASGASVPTLQAPQTNFSDAANNAAATFATLMSGRKDAEDAKGQSLNNLWINELNQKNLDVMSADIENKLASKDLTYAQRNYYQGLLKYVNTQQTVLQGQLGSLIDSAQLANEETRERMNLMRENQKNFAADTALKDIQAKLTGVQVKFEPARLRNLIDNLASSTALMGEQKNVAHQEVHLVHRQALTEQARRQGIYLDNKQAEAILPYVNKMQRAILDQYNTQNAQNQMNMFFKPLDVGKGLVTGIASGAAAVYGTKGVSKQVQGSSKSNPFSGYSYDNNSYYNFNH